MSEYVATASYNAVLVIGMSGLFIAACYSVVIAFYCLTLAFEKMLKHFSLYAVFLKFAQEHYRKKDKRSVLK